MPISEDNVISESTMQWIRSFIIEYNICPFAKHVVDKGTLTINVIHTTKLETALEEMMSAVEVLDKNPGIETTLLIFPDMLNDFFDYLDFAELAEQLLADQAYEGIYQLATFHPNYCFAGVSPDDVSNYTNRSPYPMLHLLREESIEKAIAHHGNPEQIPEDNIATMHKLGLDKIKKLLKNIS